MSCSWQLLIADVFNPFYNAAGIVSRDFLPIAATNHISYIKITPIITTSDDWRYLNSALNISGGITLFLLQLI